MTEQPGAPWEEEEEAWPAYGEVRVWTWVPEPLYRKWSTGPDEYGVMMGNEPTNPVWVEERPSPAGESEPGRCGCRRGAAKAPEVAPDYGADARPRQRPQGADDSSSTEEKVRPEGLPASITKVRPPPLAGGESLDLYPEDFSVDMTPPPSFVWGSGCYAGFAPRLCGDPLGVSRTVDDFERLAPDQTLSVAGATLEEERLIRSAWAVLLANIDLAEWAVCWARRGLVGSCVPNRIEGEGAPVMVWVWDECDFSYRAIPAPLGGWGGQVHICRHTNSWELSYLRAWRGDRYDQLCAALDLSATLLHEITHLCYLAIGDKPGTCRVSYLTENTYRWALYRRYADARLSSCCSTFYDVVQYNPEIVISDDMLARAVDDDLFYNDRSKYPACPS